MFVSRKWAKNSVAFLFVTLVLVTACGDDHAPGNKALVTAQSFFERVRDGDIDGALTYYDPIFFEAHPLETWRDYLMKARTNLGVLKKISLSESQINTIYSGRQYFYVFVNNYERGNATETITLMQPIDQPEIKIVSHKIESLLLPETHAPK